jgi:hypothetical protein
MKSEPVDGILRQALESDKTTILVTGGAGFIGSNFIRYVLTATGFRGSIVLRISSRPTLTGRSVCWRWRAACGRGVRTSGSTR